MTYLFNILPTISHINSVLLLAHSLVKRGRSVIFVGGADTYVDNYINLQGFNLVSLSSIPYGIPLHDEIDFYKRKGKKKNDLLREKLTRSFYELRKNDIEEVYRLIQFDHLVLDSYIGADFMAWYPITVNHSIRVTFVNTMSAYVGASYPLPNSISDFKNRWLINSNYYYSQLIWNSKHLFQHTVTFGRAGVFPAKPRSAPLHRKQEHNLISNYPIGVTFAGYPELILNFREFEYPTLKTIEVKHGENRIYLGLQICEQRNDRISKDDHQTYHQVISSERKKIFVSFGTLLRTDENTIRLVNAIISSAKRLPDFDFIITSVKPEVKSILPVGDNIFICNKAPQLNLLRRSVLFITHGGLNSIKEAIYSGVPMLVIPQNYRYDQVGNAAKVANLKIGRMLKKNVTDEKLFEEIFSMLKDSCLCENIAQLKIDIDAKYNAQSIDNILTQYLC